MSSTPSRAGTLPAVLRDAALRYGDAIAVRAPAYDGRIESVGYRELERRACAIREDALAGTAPGACVLLGGRGSATWIAALYAIGMAGAVAVPVDHTASHVFVATVVNAARPALAIGDRAFLTRCPATVDGYRLEDAPRRPRTPAAGPAGAAPAPGDLAIVVFTSGTTGPPKGVMLSHDNVVSDAHGVIEAVELGPGDAVFLPLPLHHSFALTVGCVAAIDAGVRLEVEHRLRHIPERLRAAAPTVIVGVPLLYESLLRGIRHQVARRGRAARAAVAAAVALNRASIRITGWNLARVLLPRVRGALGGRLRYAVAGAAALPAHLAREAAIYGIPLIQGYGLSEAGPVVAVPRFDARRFWRTRWYWDRADSVGPPIPGVRVGIEPIDGGQLDEGELVVAGRNVMLGYLGDPERTAVALRGGALHTGDLGRLDADGAIWITGRLTYTVSTPGGKLVSLEALDAFLATIADVRHACVIAERDPWRLVAIVFPAPCADIAGDSDAGAIARRVRVAIDASMRGRPAHERIDIVRLTDEPLPRSPLGKVLRSAAPAHPRFDVDRWRAALARDESPEAPSS